MYVNIIRPMWLGLCVLRKNGITLCMLQGPLSSFTPVLLRSTLANSCVSFVFTGTKCFVVQTYHGLFASPRRCAQVVSGLAAPSCLCLLVHMCQGEPLSDWTADDTQELVCNADSCVLLKGSGLAAMESDRGTFTLILARSLDTSL